MQYVIFGLVERIKAIGLTVNDRGNIDVPDLNLEKFNSEQHGLRNLEEIEIVSQNLCNLCF